MIIYFSKMKIISYNVNGIRAAIKKGFIKWLVDESPDVICLQEIKALKEQLDLDLFVDEDTSTIIGLALKRKVIVVLQF